ncbi:hypothetical protein GCM10007935_40070 [Hydrogenophaga electricum]|uniref:Rubredoxin n=1 Tax=Hydrogenophaga electricum TaxID=1230953 RepID=A0ABQ6C917_9BURK|nr:hypothetical protein GCM10007935_40070 [Hydrogenophaga electricum]
MTGPHAPPLRGSLPPEGADPTLGRPGDGVGGPHASPGGFEGSYLGNRALLRSDTRLECKICWWVYDPAEGDPQWQIPPGTPFTELPPHWRCPNCDCPPEQFMVLE